MQDSVKEEIARIYKSNSGRVLASLLRILGDLDHAEEALQEAFQAAVEKWPAEGIPDNPTAWLISTGKFKAIDALRRIKRGRELLAENFSENEVLHSADYFEKNIIKDDQLRLIFLCCHPALPLEARIALCLRDICGMSTEQIARAYLISADAIKKRISRAKKLFREKKIPYDIPSLVDMNQRLNAVLHVIYLIYNEGYAASSGNVHLRRELSDEAIYLCRQLVEMVSSSESQGLLALLLLQEARRTSRVDSTGDLIPLQKQDRSLWDKGLIREGLQLIQQALFTGRAGPYTLQAAIASVHATAASFEETPWDLIVDYYDMLLMLTPSAVVQLNRAIAVGMLQGAQAALNLLDELQGREQLKSYHLLYAARADFLKRLGKIDEAVTAYKKAISLVSQQAQKRFLEQQLEEINREKR
jgi:RNA polymerase sigma-70 factor, ECF subfamily